ncbi:MAG: metal-dependent transcriptional regulator [Clostridia bacterium]|nr:metal-dependent transcriptional regulator [Clostridia bacterium]
MINEKNNRSQEDYIESILLLREQLDFVHRVDVAKRMGVSQAAVNKAVNLLLEKNYVYEDGKHLYLTAQGEVYAREVYEKHLVIRAFLKKMGVSEKNAEEDACKLEHLVSEETLLMMKKYVEET